MPVTIDGESKKAKQVFDLTIEKNEEIVFDKAIAVRRYSELNGPLGKIRTDIGDKITWTATRLR